MTLEGFALRDLPATPWKNGGGVTREIAVWPSASNLDRFLWRVSLATVAADGPFSVFQGIDRQIMLLDGAGMRLTSADGAVDHRLDERYRPFAFSGDLAIQGDLIDGETLDFNVMSRRGQGKADLRVARASTTLEPVRHAVVLCLTGHWQAETHDLHEGDGLRWLDTPHGPELVAKSDDAAIAIATWRPNDWRPNGH